MRLSPSQVVWSSREPCAPSSLALLLAVLLSGCNELVSLTHPDEVEWIAVLENNTGVLRSAGSYVFTSKSDTYAGYTTDQLTEWGADATMLEGKAVVPAEACDAPLPAPIWLAQRKEGVLQEAAISVLPATLIDWSPPFCADGKRCNNGVCEDRVVSIVAGRYHYCARWASGRVFCWGNNSQGQCGQAAGSVVPLAAQVAGIDAIQIALGASHSCALDREGAVLCWGNNHYGQLGDGTRQSSMVPVPVANLNRARFIAAGDDHTCAIDQVEGAIFCWGANGDGQLGDNSHTDSNRPVRTLGLAEIVAITAGDRHTCSLEMDGTVRCWGEGRSGQLGLTMNDLDRPHMMALFDGVEIAAAAEHTCVLNRSNEVMCFGANREGEMGNGGAESTHIPSVVELPEEAVRLFMGTHRSNCALVRTGEVYCWGRNLYGELGLEPRPFFSLPQKASLYLNAKSIAPSRHATCFIDEADVVRCVGFNNFGQIGIDELHHTLVSKRTDADAISVSAGSAHTCDLDQHGRAHCWGANTSGQLGIGLKSPAERRTEVDLDDVASIVARYDSTCAITSDRKLHCWGGEQDPVLTDPVDQIAIGLSHRCALISGTVRCWGSNSFAQLGTQTSTETLWEVGLVSSATQVASGASHSCARLADGRISCWGRNNLGQLGQTVSSTGAPGVVPGIADAVEISLGNDFSCARLRSGQVRCWGDNNSGTLGDGSKTSTSTPMAVDGLTDATGISAGNDHVAATRTSGAPVCWGANRWGRLGVGDEELRTTPTAVIGLTNTTSTTAGGEHTCVIDSSVVHCFGRNQFGQQDSTAAFVWSPSAVQGLD